MIKIDESVSKNFVDKCGEIVDGSPSKMQFNQDQGAEIRMQILFGEINKKFAA